MLHRAKAALARGLSSVWMAFPKNWLQAWQALPPPGNDDDKFGAGAVLCHDAWKCGEHLRRHFRFVSNDSLNAKRARLFNGQQQLLVEHIER